MTSRETKQRKIIKDAVLAMGNHPTADDVYMEIHARYPNISKATVYRNLNLLSRESVLSRLNVPGGADRYDHNTVPHYHLICTQCNKYSDIDVPYQEQLNASAQAHTAYRLQGHDVIFKGLCPECANTDANCQAVK